MSIAIFLLITFILNFIIYLNIDWVSKVINVYDHPDVSRKMHKKPMPLLGGVLIYFNLVFFLLYDFFYFKDLSLIYTDYQYFLGILVPTSLFFVLGLLDDKKDLNSYLKFVLMILILILGLKLEPDLQLSLIKFSFLESQINLGNFSIPFTILSFLLFINAFNMLDGINGQAAIYTIIVFLIIFLINNSALLVLLVFSLILFLFQNFKNKTFLGDNGTLVLGYLIGFLCIKSYNLNYFEYSDEIFLIMCIPGYELLRLFIKRISEKKDPFSGDRSHLHHHLIKNYSLINTTLMMQSLFFTPYLLFVIFNSFYISLIASLSVYIIFILILKK